MTVGINICPVYSQLQTFSSYANILTNVSSEPQAKHFPKLHRYSLYFRFNKSPTRGYFFAQNIMTIEGIIANTDTRKHIEIDAVTGLIIKVGEPTGEADVIMKDELIFPGFIDLHVHAREDTSHTLDYKEDFTTVGQAAVNGGVVAFVDMINNAVPTVTDEAYLERKVLAKKSVADAVLSAGIGKNTKPLSFPVPYKVFLSQS